MSDSHDPDMNGGAREGELEDFAVEISDLPPDRRHHYILIKLVELLQRMRAAFIDAEQAANGHGGTSVPRLTRRRRRAKLGQVLTALGLCTALLLLVVGNVPGLRARFLGLFAQPTPTPAASGYFSPSQRNVPIIVERRHSLSSISNQGPLGPLPTTCPQASMLQFFLTPLDPPGLGGGPIWFTGFVGPTAALVDLQPLGTSLSHPPGGIVGWYESLAVFLQKGFPDSITLRGESQSNVNGFSLLFANAGSLNFSPVLSLHAQDLSNKQPALDGLWEMTSINVFVPIAGCYTLQTFWPDHNTRSYYFAAGR